MKHKATYRKTIKQLKDMTVKLGAGESKIIDAGSVKTAAWVRYKCQFGCSGFGDTLTCPPYSPTPGETQKILDCFQEAIIIHCHGNSHADVSEIVLKIEEEAFLAGYHKALAMGAGPCRLCAECNTKGECRNREKTRPSMEACGIDVFTTARNNGFTIDTLHSSGCKADYFGIVLIK